MLELLSSSEKDDVALRIVDVSVLYVKDSVDSILLKSAELDK